MRFLNSILAATIAASLISGCSASTQPGAPGPVAPVPVAHPAGHVSPLTGPVTYVADEASNAVSGYDHTGKPVCLIEGPSAGLSNPDFLALDASNNLYVANLKGNNVTEYGPCQSTPSQTLGGLSCPSAIAIGSAGNVYVANECGNSVTEFTGGKEVASLVNNINAPKAMVFDSQGNLYIANGGNSQHPNGWITICPHGTDCGSPSTMNIDNPSALAVDSSDNLYVADDVASPNAQITECQMENCGKTFGQGALSQPNALVFDNGNLCVSSNGNNEVVCFANNDSIYKILTKKTYGIDNPQALAVGGESQWLKVANETGDKKNKGNGSMTQYCPTFTNCKIKTIKNINHPVSIVVEP